MSIRAVPSLSSTTFGRRQPALLPSPSAYLVGEESPPPAWVADLRYFVTCYAAGLLFFLVMLS